jgi:hypothetical protein
VINSFLDLSLSRLQDDQQWMWHCNQIDVCSAKSTMHDSAESQSDLSAKKWNGTATPEELGLKFQDTAFPKKVVNHFK